MKKTMMVAISLIALSFYTSCSSSTASEPQKQKPVENVLKEKMVFDLEDGLERKMKVPFKILNPEELDSVSNNKGIKFVDWSLFVANLELMYSMKNKESYKPLVADINSVMYMKSEGKDVIVIKLACEAQNGFGNSIEKQYTIFVNYDKNLPLTESMKVNMIL